VKANVLRVANASTLAALEASLQNVGSMRSLATTMSAQDKLDVAAYINSAK
jgi:cytochrome c553